jgi:hypothetical protein
MRRVAMLVVVEEAEGFGLGGPKASDLIEEAEGVVDVAYVDLDVPEGAGALDVLVAYVRGTTPAKEAARP